MSGYSRTLKMIAEEDGFHCQMCRAPVGPAGFLDPHQWQPIETALEQGSMTNILLRTSDGLIEGYYYNGDWKDVGWYSRWLDECQIFPTHWMPLPPLPESEELSG